MKDHVTLTQQDKYIAHIAAIVESSDDAIVSKSLDGIVESWNRGAERMFGYTSEEIVGKNISMIIPEAYRFEEKNIIQRILHNETIDHYETIRRNKNGEQFFVSLTVTPLKDHDGVIYGVSKIARNIDARKRSEVELASAGKELDLQSMEKGQRAAELQIANAELLFQNEEKEKRAAELIIANKELVFQNEEKEKRASELSIANNKLAIQYDEKEKRAAELIIANKELIFQNREKEKRAAELIVANEELAYQNKEKEKRAEELGAANRQLAIQYEEKERRAGELIIANKELVFQNREKEKRAAESVVANEELEYQNKEKEKRAEELSIANSELAFQNEEKEKRAAELIIANKELIFQNREKEKRAAELIIANEELAYQNQQKEERAMELIVANTELAFQNDEKGKRAVELIIANKELEQFAYVASHDLQEPLRTVSNYMHVFEEDYIALLDHKALQYLRSVNKATERMSILIKSLLEFSRLGRNSKLTMVDCKRMIGEVIEDLDTIITKSKAEIEVMEMPQLNMYESEIRQVFQNLILNSIKFQKKDTRPKIRIWSEKIDNIYRFSIKDNGIGIAPSHFDRAFEIFQRLPTYEKYEGSGIGLANCKKIVNLHQGTIWIESVPGAGTTFHFTIANLP